MHQLLTANNREGWFAHDSAFRKQLQASTIWEMRELTVFMKREFSVSKAAGQL
jgi:hypothetical protein